MDDSLRKCAAHRDHEVVSPRLIRRVTLDVGDLPRRCVLIVDGNVMYDGDDMREAQQLQRAWRRLLEELIEVPS